MVRLTMTLEIVRALERLQNDGHIAELCEDPPSNEPAVGKPISHEQIIAISKILKSTNENAQDEQNAGYVSHHLDSLLRGSQIYIEPPKSKKEPVAYSMPSLSCTVLLILRRLRNIKP